MAEKKTNVKHVPGMPAIVIETADQEPVRKKIVDGAAVCGNCGKPLVDFSGRVKCRYCWFCGKPVLWR